MSFPITIGPKAAPKGAAKGHDAISRHIAANFYPTPPEATRALLSVERFDGPIWEPACGKGHIAKELAAHGYDVWATDLNSWGYGIVGVDFLASRSWRRCWPDGRPPDGMNIVTNPPYGRGLADDFIRKAIGVTLSTRGKIAMLLNLASLSNRDRTPFWRTLRPARIWVTDGVVCWPDPDRAPPRHFLAHRYCWVIWDGAHEQTTQLDWLSALDFRPSADR